jgi:hypothetical protein
MAVFLVVWVGRAEVDYEYAYDYVHEHVHEDFERVVARELSV